MDSYRKFSGLATTTKTERTVIAATPGWYVVIYSAYSEGREELQLVPVIGWTVTLDAVEGPRHGRIHTKHEIEPLLIGGSVHEIDDPWALKRPDGLFQLIEGGSPGTEKEIMEWFRKEHQRLNGPVK